MDPTPEYYMEEAIAEARLAAEHGDVPVGAVIVRRGEIIARAHNRREADRSATAHAEILAMEEACRVLGSWHLHECELYVTLEPCPMCAGAVVNARLPHVICGARDFRAGAMGSVIDLNFYPLNFKPKVTFGICEETCISLLRAFFKERRK